MIRCSLPYASARQLAEIEQLVFAADPLAMAAYYWPGVCFYDRQVEVIESVQIGRA